MNANTINKQYNLPHTFGSHSDLCLYCGIGIGFFGRNEGKVCPNRPANNHVYINGPDCVLCKAYGPIEDNDPCLTREQIAILIIHLKEKSGV